MVTKVAQKSVNRKYCVDLFAFLSQITLSCIGTPKSVGRLFMMASVFN